MGTGQARPPHARRPRADPGCRISSLDRRTHPSPGSPDMMYSSRRIVSLSLIILPASLVLAGCGNPADDVAPAKVSAPRPAPSPPAAANPEPGGATAPKVSAAAKLPEGAVPLPIGPEASKV